MRELKEKINNFATDFLADYRKLKARNKAQKEWMLRKTIMYIVTVAVVIAGAVMYIYCFSTCPLGVMLGIVVAFFGLGAFFAYFEEKYSEYRDKRIEKLYNRYRKYTK